MGRGAGQPELPVDAAWRAVLGLGDDEGLRLCDLGPRTVLLERVSAAGEEWQAWPFAPTLAADVAGFAVQDAFAWLERTGRSGLLHLAQRSHAKWVWLHRGEVVFAASNQMVDRLGECLLRAGVIDLEQLREAERCYAPPARFGKVLVERGFLTPRELWNGVKYQVEEIVRSLLLYRAGRLYFFEGDLQPDNVVRLALPTRRLVAEGLQRSEELQKFLRVLEGERVELVATPGAEPPVARSERALLAALRDERRFGPLCERLGVEPEAAARSVQLLRLMGAVKLVRSRDERAFVSETDLDAEAGERVRARVERLAKLLGELAAPIVAVEGAAPLRERLGRALDEVAGRHPELLAGVALGPSATLDPAPLIERALRLPARHEDEVIVALGELVAYLEFELKNHPQVPDPDGLLQGLSTLRSEALPT
jgi:hypothetical protein